MSNITAPMQKNSAIKQKLEAHNGKYKLFLRSDGMFPERALFQRLINNLIIRVVYITTKHNEVQMPTSSRCNK